MNCDGIPLKSIIYFDDKAMLCAFVNILLGNGLAAAGEELMFALRRLCISMPNVGSKHPSQTFIWALKIAL